MRYKVTFFNKEVDLEKSSKILLIQTCNLILADKRDVKISKFLYDDNAFIFKTENKAIVYDLLGSRKVLSLIPIDENGYI